MPGAILLIMAYCRQRSAIVANLQPWFTWPVICSFSIFSMVRRKNVLQPRVLGCPTGKEPCKEVCSGPPCLGGCGEAKSAVNPNLLQHIILIFTESKAVGSPQFHLLLRALGCLYIYIIMPSLLWQKAISDLFFLVNENSVPLPYHYTDCFDRRNNETENFAMIAKDFAALQIAEEMVSDDDL